MPGGGKVKAQIWDTAGQERYKAIAQAHYRNALGALVVYDINQIDSEIQLRYWLDSLCNSTDPSLEILLVGNKTDDADFTTAKENEANALEVAREAMKEYGRPGKIECGKSSAKADTFERVPFVKRPGVKE